jgi:hypothetical protein
MHMNVFPLPVGHGQTAAMDKEIVVIGDVGLERVEHHPVTVKNNGTYISAGRHQLPGAAATGVMWANTPIEMEGRRGLSVVMTTVS